MKRIDRTASYPATLQHSGALWLSVEEDRLLGFGIGPWNLHLWVNIVQIPFK